MNGRSQRQGCQNWILPKEINANRFFWDSRWLEIWKNHFCPTYGTEMGGAWGNGLKSLQNNELHFAARSTRKGWPEMSKFKDRLVWTLNSLTMGMHHRVRRTRKKSKKPKWLIFVSLFFGSSMSSNAISWPFSFRIGVTRTCCKVYCCNFVDFLNLCTILVPMTSACSTCQREKV